MKRTIHPWIRTALAAAASATIPSPTPARAELLVDLDFTSQPAGPLLFIPNAGLAGGGFQAIEQTGNDPEINAPGVLGPLAATFDGSDFLAHVESQDGPFQIVDPSLVGTDPSRTIEVWAFNPEAAGEETMVAWGRRGGPEGTNLTFNYSDNGLWGAVGHWGAPDLGWDPDTTAAFTPQLGVWHHLVYTFGPDPDDPDSTITKVYADGVLANEESLAPGTINTHGDTPIAIASQLDNNTPAFASAQRGALSLAKVRIHNTVLNDAEIAAAFDADAIAFDQRPITILDTDGDGLDDRWEMRFLGTLNEGAGADRDGDGVTNLAEFNARTHPDNADTDGDGLSDGAELNRTAGGSPAPTNPLLADTDGDGLSDGVETGTGIFSSATDTGTDPLNEDTDGDSFPDGLEVARGSNPNLASQVPDPLKLVALDALQLPLGPLETWNNTGTLGGEFIAEVDVPPVTSIEGRRGVTLDGSDDSYLGPETPPAVTGNNSRTVEAWVYNPSLLDEETIIAWGRRGGPDGTNCTFNFGAHPVFGAVGHWGAPDIGWNGMAQPGVWTMLTYAYDGASRTTRVYVDGAEANSETLGAPLATHSVDTTGAPLRFIVGAQTEANGNRTAGLRGSMTIARIDIFDLALSPEVIQRHFDELAVGFGLTPFTFTDADGDGLDDNGERFYFGNLSQTGAGDPDGDGLTNAAEFAARTNPTLADSDGDGVSDGAEVNRTVGGVPVPTNPLDPDSDGDGLPDGVETGTGVFVSASDTGTNPLVADSDGDGYSDKIEVDAGSNPNSSQSIPSITFPPILHRYAFNEGQGDSVLDSVGGAHGVILGDGADREPGQLILPGGDSGSAAYVDLPNGLLSRLSSSNGGSGDFTIEGWVTVEGGGSWPRIFDFGSNAPGGEEGEITGPGETNGGGTNGLDYILLTAYRGAETNTRRLEWAERDPSDIGTTILDFNHDTFGSEIHFAATFEEATGTLTYFENGVQIASGVTNFRLDDLNDVNNWLGRSNWTADGNLQGRFNELRIYGSPLTASQVQISMNLGPDVVPSLPTTPTLAITAVVFDSTARQTTLTWTSESGSNYRVEESGNLITWTTAEVVPGQAGSTTWTSAPVAPSITQRYYRVRLL